MNVTLHNVTTAGVFVEEKEGNDNPQESSVAVWIPPVSFK